MLRGPVSGVLRIPISGAAVPTRKNMHQDILSTFNSLLTDELIAKASVVFRESPRVVETTLRMGGAAMLADIMQKGAISELFAGIMSTSLDEDIAAKAKNFLGNSTRMNQFSSTGGPLLSGVFGGHVDRIAGTLSQVVGVKAGSVHKILEFAASMLGGVIKSFVAKRRLNAQGLASALAQERDSMTSSVLDARLTAAMGINDGRQTVASFPSAPGRSAEAAVSAATDYERQRWTQPVKRRLGWRRWAVVAAAAVLGLALSGPSNPPVERQSAAINIHFNREQATIGSDHRQAIGTAAVTSQVDGSPAVSRAGDRWSQLSRRPASPFRVMSIDDLTNFQLFCVATFSMAFVNFLVGSIQSLKDRCPPKGRGSAVDGGGT
jgi:hypothetical protein